MPERESAKLDARRIQPCSGQLLGELSGWRIRRRHGHPQGPGSHSYSNSKLLSDRGKVLPDTLEVQRSCK